MASTPPRSRFSCKEAKSKPAQLVMNTPKSNQNIPMDQDDYSPIYFPSTQETNEDIDVLWDWHSPQTSERRRRKHKRILPIQQSPKIPLKRHPSYNQNQNFEKLREELIALKAELALPDDESCLCVSPQQEMEYKKGESNSLDLKVEEEHQTDHVNNIFNDSIDEELLLFSQKVEHELEKNDATEKKGDNMDFTNICDNTEINNILAKYSSDKFKNNSVYTMQTTQSTFPNQNSKVGTNNTTSKIPIQRTASESFIAENTRNVIQTASGKLEMHRTKSFELDAFKNSGIPLPKNTLEEIEKKRQEARARLAAKQKNGSLSSLSTQTATQAAKCSSEEIEKKRLQALAKREAKRLEEMVEKNRQEAIKRLQVSRLKNANLVKGTLSNRLVN